LSFICEGFCELIIAWFIFCYHTTFWLALEILLASLFYTCQLGICACSRFNYDRVKCGHRFDMAAISAPKSW
jgi:hypothetical protein